MKNKTNIIYPSITLIILLIAWEVIVGIFEISEIIFPAPSTVATSIKENINSLGVNTGITFYVSFIGFMISTILSFILTTIFHFSKILRQALFPLAISTRAIPIIALAPVIVLWFGTGNLSKIFLSALITFFPILINQMKGITYFDKNEIDLLHTFTRDEWKIYMKVRIPNSLPFLFAGLKIATAFSVIGAIVAEFTGSNKGIGYIIKSSTYYNETPLTFAAIFFAASIGLIFYELVAKIERKVVFWSKDL